MAKLNLDNLVLCITRRCNMTCEHCLRGTSTSINMTDKIIDLTLKNISYISSVTFTGGEPSLNVHSIKYFIQRLRDLDIILGFFYIVTNGKIVSKDLALTLLELYEMVEEPELCQFTISRDQFHDYAEAIEKNTIYDGLRFYAKKERPEFLEERFIINEGNAKDNQLGSKELAIPILEVEEFNNDLIIRDTLYIGATGNILTTCDCSYDNEDRHILGNIYSTSLWYLANRVNLYNTLEKLK